MANRERSLQIESSQETLAFHSSDLLCGGFPCQAISRAGRRKGEWLWSLFRDCIVLTKPKYVLIENVPTLTKRGGVEILNDLASLGYDAEWESIPAYSVGAPHIRDRIFIVAYSCEGRHWSQKETIFPRGESPKLSSWWEVEPRMDRMADGVPNRVERIKALGEAVVPQISEWIGMKIRNRDENLP